MNPPGTSVFARPQQPHVPDHSTTGRKEAASNVALEGDAARFGRRPYSPPTLELLQD